MAALCAVTRLLGFSSSNCQLQTISKKRRNAPLFTYRL
ncbi:hypothetical protein APA_1674 [Pseudanabaena sp. lw0831]|nr:hypothetical protein APA_1674 [Pseudanabaena sp. lw0831]